MSGYQSEQDTPVQVKSSADLRAELGADLAKHQDKIGALRKEIADAEDQLSGLIVQIAEAKSEYEKQSVAIEEQRKAIEKTHSEFLLTQGELAKTLRVKTAEFERTSVGREVELSSLADSLENQRKDISAGQFELAERKRALDEQYLLREKELDARERKVKDREEIVVARASALNADAEELQKREKVIDDTRKQLAAQESSLNTRQAELDAYSATLLKKAEDTNRVFSEAKAAQDTATQQLAEAKDTLAGLVKDRESLDIYKTELLNFEQVLKRRESSVKERELIFNQSVKGVGK